MNPQDSKYVEGKKNYIKNILHFIGLCYISQCTVQET
jgi:hypothetical protein